MRAVLDEVLAARGAPALTSPSPRARLAAVAQGAEALVAALEEAAPAALVSARYEAAGSVIALQERLEGLGRALDPDAPDAAARSARLASWEGAPRRDLGGALARLAEECAAERVSPDDLPDEVRARFVGRSGEPLLRVFPRGNVWEVDHLGRFLDDLDGVVTDVSGVPVHTDCPSDDFPLQAVVNSL